MAKSSGKTIARNTIFLYIRMGVVLLVGLYTTRVVLRVLGVEDYGVYGVIGGFVSMFGVLNTSLSSGINRFYNYYIGKNDGEGVKAVYNSALRIQFITMLIVLLLVETVGLWYLNNKMVLPVERIQDARVLFHCSVFSLLLMLLQAPYSAAVTAYEKMDYYAIISIVDVLLKLAIVFLLQITDHDKLLFYGVLMTIVSVANFLLYFGYCKIHFKNLKFSRRYSRTLFKSMISFSGWSLLDPLSYMVRGQGCNMILNYYFGPIVNAAYSISNQIAVSLDSFSMNLTLAFRPQIIQAYSAKEYTRSVSLVSMMSRIMYALNLMIFLPFIFEIDYILTLWLGDTYPPLAPSFTLLILILKLVTVLNPPLTNLMSAMGKINGIMTCSFITICSIVPFAILFFNKGAAPESMYVLMIILAVINQIVSAYIVAKQFSYFEILEYLTQVIVPCILLSVAVLAPLLLIHHFMLSSMGRLLISLSISVILSVILGYYILLNREERERIVNIIKTKTLKK